MIAPSTFNRWHAIIAEYQAGKSVRALAEDNGISYMGVLRGLRKHGVDTADRCTVGKSCHGAGKTCPTCGLTGRSRTFSAQYVHRCPHQVACRGAGKAVGEVCNECEGKAAANG